MMIRVGVCDDVQIDVEALSSCIEDWTVIRNVHVQLKKFRSGEEVLFDLEQQGDFAAVFLDVVTGGINGIKTAVKLREKNRLTSIVFVSRYEQNVKEMFKVYPFLYIEKPISRQKVFQVLDQIVEEQKIFNESFTFQYNRTTFNIDLRKVLYFASEKRMIRVLMEDGREHVFYKKLDELETILAGYNHHFVRIHQSFLVNERQIEQYHSRNIVMRNGDILTVSRDKRTMIFELHMKLFEGRG